MGVLADAADTATKTFYAAVARLPHGVDPRRADRVA